MEGLVGGGVGSKRAVFDVAAANLFAANRSLHHFQADNAKP